MRKRSWFGVGAGVVLAVGVGVLGEFHIVRGGFYKHTLACKKEHWSLAHTFVNLDDDRMLLVNPSTLSAYDKQLYEGWTYPGDDVMHALKECGEI
jgi:hypothetical protein